MKTLATILSLAAFAHVAHGVTGTYTWQVSSDNGATWSGVCVGTAGSTIKVRLLASWTDIPPSLVSGYAGGQFDATLVGADAGDVVSNIARPSPFNFAAQTPTVYAINGGIKIDTATDSLEPGLGTGWLNPGQVPPGWWPFNFNSANPATILTYDVLCSGQNEITIGSVLNTQAGRAMAIYSNEVGTQLRLSSPAITNIFAFIAPAPAPLVLIGLAGVTTTRRRRTTPCTSTPRSNS